MGVTATDAVALGQTRVGPTLCHIVRRARSGRAGALRPAVPLVGSSCLTSRLERSNGRATDPLPDLRQKTPSDMIGHSFPTLEKKPYNAIYE